MKARITSIVVHSAIITVVCLMIFLASTWWRLHEQFERGESSFNRGDFSGAVAGYESAIHMYIPFNPQVEKSAQKLWALAESNERLGDINRAMIAYRALRSSFYSAQWLVTPGVDWIARCDKKIAALVPLQKER